MEMEIQQPIKLNPFLIPHVVQRILSYCKFTDLKTTRLVSRLWEECGTIYFHQRRTLRFKNFQHIDAFLLNSYSSSGCDLVNLDDPYQQFSKNICQNISLHGPDFQNWIILLKPFLSKFGHSIKSISISHGLGPDVTEDLLLQIAQHVDALEELSISGSTVLYSTLEHRYGGGGNIVGGDGSSSFHFQPIILSTVKRIELKLPVTCFKRWYDVRRFFIHFFSIFPNLEDIKFVGCQFPELFEYLPTSIHFRKLHSLHLQLLNSSGLDKLMRRGFHIDKMILEIEPLLGLNHLHNFLESFSNSLSQLELRFQYNNGVGYNYSHNATAFPSSKVLRRVEKLNLFGYWGHLYFLKEFPAPLKSVTVEKMNWAIAFPRGTDQVGSRVRKILKFFDENDVYHDLNY